MFEFMWFAMAVATGMIIATIVTIALYTFVVVKYGKKLMKKYMSWIEAMME